MLKVQKLRIANARGSVLVLVTLVSLVLAALAIMALRNVSRTVQQAAVYQTRQQSMLTSSGALSLFGKRVGDKASLVYNRMTQRTLQQEGGDRSVLAGGRNMASRKKEILSGQFAVYHSEDFSDFLPQGGGETGLFTDGVVGSFEGQNGRTTGFQTIIRDPMDAQAASGFDNSYCFKKVTIASEATIGGTPCADSGDCAVAGDICRGGTGGAVKDGFCDDGWKRLNTISQTRSGMEGLIGPIECGY